jgi:hypothetical protein
MAVLSLTKSALDGILSESTPCKGLSQARAQEPLPPLQTKIAGPQGEAWSFDDKAQSSLSRLLENCGVVQRVANMLMQQSCRDVAISLIAESASVVSAARCATLLASQSVDERRMAATTTMTPPVQVVAQAFTDLSIAPHRARTWSAPVLLEMQTLRSQSYGLLAAGRLQADVAAWVCSQLAYVAFRSLCAGQEAVSQTTDGAIDSRQARAESHQHARAGDEETAMSIEAGARESESGDPSARLVEGSVSLESDHTHVAPAAHQQHTDKLGSMYVSVGADADGGPGPASVDSEPARCGLAPGVTLLFRSEDSQPCVRLQPAGPLGRSTMLFTNPLDAVAASTLFSEDHSDGETAGAGNWESSDARASADDSGSARGHSSTKGDSATKRSRSSATVIACLAVLGRVCNLQGKACPTLARPPLGADSVVFEETTRDGGEGALSERGVCMQEAGDRAYAVFESARMCDVLRVTFGLPSEARAKHPSASSSEPTVAISTTMVSRASSGEAAAGDGASSALRTPLITALAMAAAQSRKKAVMMPTALARFLHTIRARAAAQDKATEIGLLIRSLLHREIQPDSFVTDVSRMLQAPAPPTLVANLTYQLALVR